MAARYYSPNDPESYVTPSRLKRLSRAKQVEYMAHWFRGMFEDPQNETPYAIDKDSPYNYEYIWGGPYDARDELGHQFGGIVPDDVIELAIKEVERDGTVEWAPGPDHPDQQRRREEAMAEQYVEPPPPALEDIQRRLENGVVPAFGDRFERQERDALRRQLAELRNLVAQDLPQHAGIGHNQPPEHLALTVELKIETIDAIDKMDAELAKDTPDVAVVAESAGRLQKVLGWIGRKLDKSIDNFMSAIGTAGGVAVAAHVAGLPVADKISQAVEASLRWLNNVTLPF